MKVIDDLILMSNSIKEGKFETVSVLPSDKLFNGRIVYLSTDNKYYYYNGTQWSLFTPEYDDTALKNDIKNLQNNKVDRQEGKGLSTNDLTDELLDKIINSSSSDSLIHYGTKEHWNSQLTLIGEKSNIYIYSDYASKVVDDKTILIPNIKIGDSTSYLIDIPFVTESVEDLLNSHINDKVSHITSPERNSWNGKVSCHIDPEDSENIIFSNL